MQVVMGAWWAFGWGVGGMEWRIMGRVWKSLEPSQPW
jgi:hypothetical protein